MNQLVKLQHTFQNYVIRPDNIGSITWVSASGRATPEIQLSKYAYAYGARLKEVLATDYPAVLMAIGDDRFNQLAENYIQTHPSRYFSLRDFGRYLPDFISDLVKLDVDYQNMYWLVELALFEWTLGQAFDAADVTLFTEQDMATIPAEAWADVKFTLHPSVHRLDFEWNIVEMWQALTADEPTEVTAQRETGSPWLIWREQLTTRFRSMPADEQLALDTLRQGVNFNDICGSLATLMHEDDVPLHAATLLKGWIVNGLISKVD